MSKIPVFVSSVQKELEHERIAIASLITTDPFLLQHCEPVLFERLPASGKPRAQPYLACLDSCRIYLLLVAREYGRPDGDLSPTHHEYRRAQERKLPSLVFIKGDSSNDKNREAPTQEFFRKIREAGHTYKRFIDREDLKPEVRAALLHVLKESFHIAPTNDEAVGGREQIEAASPFEATPLPGVSVAVLDKELLGRFVEQAGLSTEARAREDFIESLLHARGLLWQNEPKTGYFATAAANVVFGPRPADGFPQCEIFVDAYAGTTVTGQPRGQANLNLPLPRALEEIMAFIDRHTFHPTRVIGINNVTLDEYPSRALREAVVNAVAHRDYADAGRKVSVQVFSDRVVISSPGLPPSPLTLAKLQRGSYRPCSRNPVIAQTLAALRLMEQRGSGFARMREAMLDHGLETPSFTEQDGYFVVTFPGPNGSYERLKVSSEARGLIAPSIEAQLNERQRKILEQAQRTGAVTNKWVQETLAVVRDTAFRDLQGLVDLKLLHVVGGGRSTRYEPYRGED